MIHQDTPNLRLEMNLKELSLPLLLFFCCCLVFFEHSISQDFHLRTNYGNNRGIGFQNASERSMLEISGQVGAPEPAVLVVNVDDFGAKADGKTDDSKAFGAAWAVACSCPTSAVLLIPDRTYLLKPLVFHGPCSSCITVMIKGTLEAPSNQSDWEGRETRHWILFNRTNNLIVEGGGMINGNGHIWWKNSCKVNKSLPCSEAPTALTFYSCNELRVEDLRIKDSQQMHLSFERCRSVQASKLAITAPERSPNTDGIHVARSRDMHIADCDIKTGDDCISIVSGSQGIKVTNISCGPGHGISIGSLGAHNSEAHVTNVMVDNARLTGTSNGVRIKTWQGGHGTAQDISFQNIAMNNVQNPIIIDQHYCDSKDPCPEQKSAVKVSGVVYKNIRGTSASDVAVNFNCSRSDPCVRISLQHINLVGENGCVTKSSCSNVEHTALGKVLPHC